MTDQPQRQGRRPKKLHYRTVFISDLHLGSYGAQAKELSRFLKKLRCDKLYLIGDVIDMWRLRKRWWWPNEHNDVVRRILRLAKKGTEVIYIPGNHDEAARQYANLEFGGVRIKLSDLHQTADGRTLLITHGDQFDLVVKHHPLLSAMGGLAYEWLLRLNVLYNFGRKAVGLKHWSLSYYIKMRVKQACTFISRYEDTLMKEARRRHADGVVCGHIHKGECRADESPQYFNCGDWVESNSAMVEHFDGSMELIDGVKAVMDLRIAKELARRRDTATSDTAQPESVPLSVPVSQPA
jgi:UDP-2,3-diacylglucosamine pyrophosphatase LpxH